MSIEFVCVECRQLLRVPDELVGKFASCPSCSTVLSVPRELQPVIVPTPAAVESASDNPYATPVLLEDDVDARAAVTWVVEPTRITIRELLGLTRRVFSKHIAAFSLLGLVMVGLAILMQVMSFVLESQFSYSPLALLWPGVRFLWLLTSFAIQVAMILGGFNYCLRLLRTGQTRLALFFDVGPFLLPGVLHYFLVGIALAVGFAGMSLASAVTALPENYTPIVQFVYVFVWGLLMLSFWAAIMTGGVFIVDRREGALAAFRSAWVCSRGNRLALMVTTVLVGALSLLLAMCTLYIALVLVWPYFCLLTCVAYLLMTGQRTSIAPAALGQSRGS